MTTLDAAIDAAERVHEALAVLNVAVAEASRAGLRVEFRTIEYSEIGAGRRTLLSCEVVRPLPPGAGKPSS